MKITIGGSMTFAGQQISIRDVLVKMGHEVLLTDDIDKYANNSLIKNSFEEELRISREFNIIKTFFNKISEADAFLVCNYDKNGVNGYLGTSVLMETGLAYYLDKKIYLLNAIDSSQKYALELAIINPTILNGDLTKIN